MTDNVRQQPHYAHGIEPIEYMQSRFTPEEMRGFLAGNVIKYISRFTRKDGVSDLQKAQDYLERLIAHERETTRKAVEASLNDQLKQAMMEPGETGQGRFRILVHERAAWSAPDSNKKWEWWIVDGKRIIASGYEGTRAGALSKAQNLNEELIQGLPSKL